jgi:hypothetical protein
MITNWQAWLAADRPHIFWGRHPKLRSVGAYLQGVKSGHYRGKIRAELRKRLGGRWRGMNPRIRECLHDAVFVVMDDLESRNGGQPDHPSVVQMCIALNLLADDLRWNDEGGRR